MTQVGPYKARGVASWYGKRYHGQKTSSGEIYDMYAMSAAHTVLPLPSYVRVTNAANGKSVVVRVNDRGPFHEDRLIDLSYAAAHRIGLIGQGSGLVEIEAIVPGTVDAVPPPPPPVEAAAPPAPVSTESGGTFVQLGAFSVADNAESFARKLRVDLAWLAGAINVTQRNGLNKVQAGPYASREEALQVAGRVQKEMGFKAIVLDR
jgi:rare lipoprotein A